MGAKEFVDDFKEMLKTKDMTKFNQKYTKPAMEQVKKGAIVAKDAAVKYTPVVVDAAKKGCNKAYAVYQEQMAKKKAADAAKKGTEVKSQEPKSGNGETKK
jgi:hypothetical protein